MIDRDERYGELGRNKIIKVAMEKSGCMDSVVRRCWKAVQITLNYIPSFRRAQSNQATQSDRNSSNFERTLRPGISDAKNTRCFENESARSRKTARRPVVLETPRITLRIAARELE